MPTNFTHEGQTYLMVEERYTLGEIDALERSVGLKFADFSDPENEARVKSTGAVMTMMWVSAKRTNPTLTLADVSGWVLEDIEWETVPDPTQPPTGESGNESSSTNPISPKGGAGPRKKPKH